MTLEDVPLWIESGDTAVVVAAADIPVRVVPGMSTLNPFASLRRAVYREQFSRDLAAALRSEPTLAPEG